MKKYLKLFRGLIIALMILVPIQPHVFAETSMTWFDFHYRYINNGTEIEITSYWGTDPDITVPSRIYDVPVTSVNLLAILHPEALRSVGIPAGVTEIKAGSLANCPNLRELNFWGNAPRVYGSQNGQPFANNAPNFKIYYLPGKTGFTNPWYGHSPAEAPAPLVDHAYYKSKGYTYQILPDNSAAIVKYTYGDYQPDVVIPAQLEGHPVRKIGPNAFKYVRINSVSIPEGVRSISEYAFQYCGLKDVTIPGSVTRIEEGAFYHCGLERVSLPRQVTFIGDEAFKECSELRIAKFFGEPPSIGVLAFESCAPDFTIYYLPGVSGFTDPWNGYKTAELPTVPNNNGGQQQASALVLQAQASPANITLSWNQITDSRGISGFNVYKGTSPQELTSQTIAEAYVTGTAYSDRLVQSGTVYYYCVKPVYGDNSTGTPSNIVSAATQLSSTYKKATDKTSSVTAAANVPPALPVSGIPGTIPAPTISNLQLLNDDNGVPYFRMEVFIPEIVRILDQVRPSDGWVDLESLKIIDGGDEIPDGGGLEAFMQAPVLGKPGVYYITFEVIDEGGLTETLINSRRYTFKARFSYAYGIGDGYEYVYSPWSNELSGQSDGYHLRFSSTTSRRY